MRDAIIEAATLVSLALFISMIFAPRTYPQTRLGIDAAPNRTPLHEKTIPMSATTDNGRSLFVAERLCTAMGYQWPCHYDRYSVKWSEFAVSKYWIELAEHAQDAADEFDNAEFYRRHQNDENPSVEGDMTGTV